MSICLFFLYLNYSYTYHKLLRIISHKVNHRRQLISSSVLIRLSPWRLLSQHSQHSLFVGLMSSSSLASSLALWRPLSECFTGCSAPWKACMAMALFSVDQEPSALDPVYLTSGVAQPVLPACAGDSLSGTNHNLTGHGKEFSSSGGGSSLVAC